MSLNYELLGGPQAEHIRKQRLLDLEADHYRYVLDAEELPEDADPTPIMAKLADVERRIALHRRALGMSEQVSTPDGVSMTPEGSDAK